MSESIVAVAGTLLGGLLTFLATDWRARKERSRREFVDAINAVLAAFVGFREQQYLKIADRRAGIPDTRETRQARYAARTALTAAIDQLHTATADQRLLDAVEEARRFAVALGDAAPADRPVDEVAVADIGDQARQAHTMLRQAARHALHH